MSVADPSGRLFDLATVVNTNALDRRYRALQGQMQYRVSDQILLGGNYTLSNSYGNFNAENVASGPVQDDFLAYVEYKQESWNTPTGDLGIDQRHKLRLWANYEKGFSGAGRLNIGLLGRVNSGQPYSAAGSVDSRPFVANPGYLTPPTTVTYYYGGGRGIFKTDTVSATDLSVNYYLPAGFVKRGEFFVRLVVDNLFNQAAQVSAGNQTVFSAASQNPARTMQAFNPFTTVPVAGINYELGPDFGKALSAGDYQSARSYFISVGFRDQLRHRPVAHLSRKLSAFHVGRGVSFATRGRSVAITLLNVAAASRFAGWIGPFIRLFAHVAHPVSANRLLR